MGLREHAEAELALMGMGKETEDDYNRLMHDSIMQIVDMFASQGHSGFSASYALGILEKLLAYEPLSPLTGEDSEWSDISEMQGGKPGWQNVRCSHVFKDEHGKAYDIEGRIFRDTDGSTYTGKGSMVYVDFPYVPKREYVDKPSED